MFLRKCRTLWNSQRTQMGSNIDKNLFENGLGINFLASKSHLATKDITAVQNAALDNDQCLLVDENDNLTGSASKRECHRVGPDGKLLLHRAFSVLLFNSAGELLVQKRARQKVTYPSTYTNTCCSHPLMMNGAPEDITTAAIRRLDTELGIPASMLKREDFTLLARILYKDHGDGVWGEHELDYVLVVQKNLSIAPNPDEIELVKYIPRNQFDSFIEDLEDPVTPWFRLMHRHMLHHWWRNLHRLHDIAEPQLIQSFIND